MKLKLFQQKQVEGDVVEPTQLILVEAGRRRCCDEPTQLILVEAGRRRCCD